MLHTYDPATADAIRASLPSDLLALAAAGTYEPTPDGHGRHWRSEPGADLAATQVIAAPRDPS
jgi:phospholipid/cholesterol/gamma-HCH transport system ATP-binding protein